MMIIDLREFIIEKYYEQLCFNKQDRLPLEKAKKKIFGNICY